MGKMLSNKQIRKKAWGLAGKNLHRVLAAYLVLILTAGVFGAFIGVSAAFQLMPVAIAFSVLLALFMPVLEVGFMQYFANIWRGRRPRLFHSMFCHTRRILRLWGIMLLTALIVIAIALPWLIGMVAVNASMFSFIGEVTATVVTEGAATMPTEAAIEAATMEILNAIAANPMPLLITVLLVLLMYFVLIWISLRLSLTLPAFILNPERRAGQCIRLSMRASKGNSWRIFCNGFMLGLPMFIASILIALLDSALINVENQIIVIAVGIITALIQLLFAAYVMLGQFGLARQLLRKHTGKQKALPAPEE